MRILKWETGVLPPPPLKNHKNIGYFTKVTKLPSQHSMLGLHLPASETPFKMAFRWWAYYGPFNWYLDLLSLHKLKNKSWTPLIKLSGSAHGRHTLMSATAVSRDLGFISNIFGHFFCFS